VVSEQTGQGKPNLYVLSIGVSRYPKLPRGDQLEFAHTDAEALVAALKPQERKLFEHVYSHVLTNEAVTQAAILDRIEALSAIDKNDLEVIFLAGHGTKGKADNLYFLTPDGSREHPEQGGLDWTVLGEWLSRIPGWIILFLDACRSWGLVSETVVPNDELARQLLTRGGGVMVFSASKGWQPSYEPEKGVEGSSHML
jgi:hypothetical protein